jgi:outer membrane protein, heavy metal efflux system
MTGKTAGWSLAVLLPFGVCGCGAFFPERCYSPVIPASPCLPISSASQSGIAPSLVPVTGPLSFVTVVQLAAQHNPDMGIARAQAEAARGKMVQAGLYPNPTLGWEASDMGNSPDGSAGKQGPTLGFTVVTGGKLGIAQSAASHAVAAADWNATMRWYEILVKLRTAFYDTLAAQLEVQESEELVKITEQSLATAEKLEKSSVGDRPDVLRARVEMEQSRNRLEVAQRRADTTRARLAAAMGLTELPPYPLVGSLKEAVPAYSLPELKAATLERSSEIRAAQAAVGEAEALFRRAQAETVPNLDVTLYPFYDFAERRAGGEVTVGAQLPLCNKNQGNIFATQAEITRAQLAVRQAEVRVVERLNVAYQQYAAAKRQAENFEQRILPNARESLRLILLGYETSDSKYDFTTVLQAQSVLAQARLTYVQVLNDLQRAVSEIEGVVQREPEGFFLKP